ncbi:MAG: hypothetical protein WCV84_04140 [Patescibacteria group bacterium]
MQVTEVPGLARGHAIQDMSHELAGRHRRVLELLRWKTLIFSDETAQVQEMNPAPTVPLHQVDLHERLAELAHVLLTHCQIDTLTLAPRRSQDEPVARLVSMSREQFSDYVRHAASSPGTGVASGIGLTKRSTIVNKKRPPIKSEGIFYLR